MRPSTRDRAAARARSAGVIGYATLVSNPYITSQHEPGTAPRLPLWLRVVSRLPWKVLYGCAACLALLAYRVVRYRLTVVRANIDASFPDLNGSARRAIERDYYRN